MVSQFEATAGENPPLDISLRLPEDWTSSRRRGAARRARGMATLKKAHRILLIDDHPIVREGLTALLRQSPEYAVCGEASGIEDGMQRLRELSPDAVILDISLGRESGLNLIAQARKEAPHVAILVLSTLDEMTYAGRALRRGASGYVMKQEATSRLLSALQRVLTGKVWVSPAVSERLLTTLAKPGVQAHDSVDRLTDRELEIFRLVGMGVRSVDIARKLGISHKTIETHRVRIKAKLGIETASELVIQASSWLRDGQLK
jgi:DNA-binding NarL/FixJ family response regulator